MGEEAAQFPCCHHLRSIKTAHINIIIPLVAGHVTCFTSGVRNGAKVAYAIVLICHIILDIPIGRVDHAMRECFAIRSAKMPWYQKALKCTHNAYAQIVPLSPSPRYLYNALKPES